MTNFLESFAQLNLYQTIYILITLRGKPLENIVGKGENGGYQHFLFYPQCLLFSSYKTQMSLFLGKNKFFTKQQNFVIIQIGSMTVQTTNRCDQRIQICVEQGIKHRGKRRKMLLTFSHTVFKKPLSKGREK